MLQKHSYIRVILDNNSYIHWESRIWHAARAMQNVHMKADEISSKPDHFITFRPETSRNFIFTRNTSLMLSKQ